MERTDVRVPCIQGSSGDVTPEGELGEVRSPDPCYQTKGTDRFPTHHLFPSSPATVSRVDAYSHRSRMLGGGMEKPVGGYHTFIEKIILFSNYT